MTRLHQLRRLEQPNELLSLLVQVACRGHNAQLCLVQPADSQASHINRAALCAPTCDNRMHALAVEHYNVPHMGVACRQDAMLLTFLTQQE